MTNRRRLLLPAAAGLVALAAAGGCSTTAPLGGTTWRVTQVLATEQTDFTSMVVEFGRDGWITTTTVDPDGSVHRGNRERYRVQGRMFTITHPDYELDVLFRRDGDELRVVSEQFHAILESLDEGGG